MADNIPDIALDKITVDRIEWPVFANHQIEADILRLDKIHPLISGNKWFKLQGYIKDALAQRKKTILTFGGAWSNHIIATAAACKLNGLHSIGIIRGEEPAVHAATLRSAQSLGMQLHFISRDDYRQKKIPLVLDNDMFVVNEGGWGTAGMNGAASILDHCTKNKYTHICCAAGTGTMTAGLLKASAPSTKILSVIVMRSNPEIKIQVEQLIQGDIDRCDFMENYHFGGYAKFNQALIDFMNNFYRATAIPTDFVYTGKMCYAVSDLAEKKYFPAGSRLLLIHSGGLQGNISMDKGTLMF